MIITMKKHTDVKDVQELLQSLKQAGFQTHRYIDDDYHVYGITGDTAKLDMNVLYANKHVDQVIRVAQPYKLVSRSFHPKDTIVNIGGVHVGKDQKIAVIAGPCSIEGKEQIDEIAEGVQRAGALLLRGGAYKPRTSPYSYQGLGSEGIQLLKQAGNSLSMPIVSELMSEEQLEEFIEHVDLIQVGARNMQNFPLLKALGNIRKPVLLKRGFSNTIEEWLMAAEYILAGGNEQVILCERGIRTFEPYTRNTLDLSVIPIVKEKTHLPIIIDPSHATGDWKLVESMSLAAIAAGADGLMIEVHNQPECAWSDGMQSLKIETFEKLMEKARKIANVLGREM